MREPQTVWIVWNTQDLRICGIYATEQAAKASLDTNWTERPPEDMVLRWFDHAHTVEHWPVAP